MSKPSNTAHRSKGEGTLVKRGRFFHVKWMVNGEMFSQSTGCTNKKDAEKVREKLVAPFKTKSKIDALAVIKQRLESTPIPDETKNKPTEIRYLWDKYVSDVSVNTMADNTVDLYNKMLTFLEKFCKNNGLEYAHQIKVSHVESLLSELKSKVQSCTYNQYLKCYKMIFGVVKKHDNNIIANPFEDFKLLKVDQSKRRRELTDEELKRLHEVVGDMGLDIRLLFALGEYEGMRISDACLCKWEHIDWKSRKIRFIPIKTKKNGCTAVVPMHDKVYALLKDRLALSSKDDVFVSPLLSDNYKSKKISYLVRKIFKDAKIRTSVKDASGKWNTETGFHSLRHTFASRCSRDGIPISQIQFMLGHSSPMMSLEYTHTKEKDLILPEFDENLTTVKIKTSTYEKLKDVMKDNESFEDCIDRVIRFGMIDWEAVKRNEEERKRKESAEIDALIEEVFYNNK